MPSLDVAPIPAAGVLKVQIPIKDKTLAVLKITNLTPRLMYYGDKSGIAGDPIPPNNGSCAYHYVDGDRPPNTFWITGTAADEPQIYFVVRDDETK